MNLHRASRRADWANVQPVDRTTLQIIADRTNGLVTPGNIITGIGAMLVIGGLLAIGMQHYWIGGALLLSGRACDLLDGWLADITATKSPLGESFDALIDKVGTALTIMAFLAFEIAPWWVLLLLLLPHIIISAVVWHKRRQGVRVHPSQVGKISMALAWIALLGLLLVAALGIEWPGAGVLLVYGLAGMSVVLGLYACAQYMRAER